MGVPQKNKLFHFNLHTRKMGLIALIIYGIDCHTLFPLSSVDRRTRCRLRRRHSDLLGSHSGTRLLRRLTSQTIKDNNVYKDRSKNSLSSIYLSISILQQIRFSVPLHHRRNALSKICLSTLFRLALAPWCSILLLVFAPTLSEHRRVVFASLIIFTWFLTNTFT